MTAARRLKSKICLVGEKMVGKTSLIRRYVLNTFSDTYLMTLGMKVLKKEVEVGLLIGAPVHMNLMIWDFMGQEGFRELLKEAYFSGARGILAVCDVTRRPTLEALGPWIESVRSVAGYVPTFLAVNKSDLGRAAYTDADIQKFSNTYGCGFIRTSAKTGQNVEEAFRRLATSVAADRIVRA